MDVTALSKALSRGFGHASEYLRTGRVTPSTTADARRAAAAQLGLQFIEGSAVGDRRGIRVSITSELGPETNSDRYFTRIVCQFPAVGPRITIRPQTPERFGWASHFPYRNLRTRFEPKISPSVGGVLLNRKDVQINDPEFDGLALILTDDANTAWAYLNPERRQAIREILETHIISEVRERELSVYFNDDLVATPNQLASEAEWLIERALIISKPTTIDLTQQRRQEVERALPHPPSPPQNPGLIS